MRNYKLLFVSLIVSHLLFTRIKHHMEKFQCSLGALKEKTAITMDKELRIKQICFQHLQYRSEKMRILFIWLHHCTQQYSFVLS